MSGVAKGVKKVFRKVAKVAKTVIPSILGIGALVFTAGAALGVPGTAGGWGGAVNRLVGSLGAGDVLTQTLSGALTTAGYGAVLGGALGLATDKGIMKGAQYGTLAGGAAGAVLGGTGTPYDPLAGIGTQPAAAAAAAPAAAGAVPGPGGAMPGTIQVTPVSATGPIAGGGGAAATTGQAVAAGARGFAPPASWLERNQALVGSVIQGVGSGLSSMAEGEDYRRAAEISLERDERGRDYMRRNFGTGEVRGYRGFRSPGRPQPTPVQRYDPQSYRTEFQYDPAQGRIVRIPVED